ncbi:MAG: hypothetical protein ACU84J_07665 [Gammaproteobacteria bacterium]
MTKKTPSKLLLNIEKHFAHDNPTLLQAAKVFHELDQIEFELGLLDNDETTASKHSWWPIISVMGGVSSAASKFIEEYLDTDRSLAGIQSANHKFTVIQHNNQSHPVTLPGTALDADHRLPFYQISRKIDRLAPGEGSNINSYLELKTVNNARLRGKLIIESPDFGMEDPVSPISKLLINHTIEISDLVLVFCDIFDAEPHLLPELTKTLVSQQDSNKFVYIIDNTVSSPEIVRSWQKRLAEMGIKTAQFVILSSLNKLSDPQNRDSLAIINQRISSIDHYRSYRILSALERNIQDIHDIIIPEINQAISLWKDRANFSSLLILGFIATLMLFAEIHMGFFAVIFDPIIGPLFLLGLIALMAPLHIVICKLQAKLIVARLSERQKELHLMENLADMFEKSLTYSRMLLPVSSPVGWNKKTKGRLKQLVDKAKSLVLSLNDGFSVYDEVTDLDVDTHSGLANLENS